MTVAASLTDSAGPPVASDATAGGETAVTAGSGSYGGSRKDHESTAVIPAGASARISMSGASVRNAGLSSKDLCLLRLLAGSMFFYQFNVSSIAPLLPSFAKLFHLPETSSTLLLAGRSTAAILFALPACPLLSSVTTLCGLTVTLLLYGATLVLLAYPSGPLWLAGALMLQGVCTQLVRAGALSFATHAHSPSASAASASASASPSPLSGEIRRKDQAKEGARKELPQVLPGEDGALSPHPSDLVPALDPAPLALGGESASSAEASPRTGKSRAPIETAAAEAPGKAAAEAPKTAAAALGGRELLFGAVAMLFAWAAVGSVAGPVTMTFLFQFGSPSLPFLFSLGIDLFLLFLLLIILPCCCGGRRRTKVVDVESSAPDGTVAGGTATGASAPITDSLPTWQLQVSEQERPVVYRGAPIFAIPSRGAPLNRSTSLTRSTSARSPSSSAAGEVPLSPLRSAERGQGGGGGEVSGEAAGGRHVAISLEGQLQQQIEQSNQQQQQQQQPQQQLIVPSAKAQAWQEQQLQHHQKQKQKQSHPNQKVPAVHHSKPHPHHPNQRLTALRLFATMLTDSTSATMLALTFLQTLSTGLLEVTVSFFLDNTCDRTPSEIGLSMGINGAAYALFSLLFGGWLIRKLGPPVTITLGAATIATALPLLVIPGVSCKLHVLYPLMALTGVAYSLVEFPSLPCIIQALDKRAAAGEGSSDVALAVGMFNLAYTAGYASGPLLSALLGLWLKAWMKMMVMSGAFLLLLPFLCCMRR